ncbi:MAG: hypothetical protein QOF33_2999 [Thermomicrobiales bacterium]|jgi:hypothetical protein|nr:hypothetical protein [Thermomicrobiales bacterium]MEA2584914.1 hypothetical protein [Thermomicrobiales bacterium]MEA2597706.1 hypothetical protein [Thermomicrobiales bacterium]
MASGAAASHTTRLRCPFAVHEEKVPACEAEQEGTRLRTGQPWGLSSDCRNGNGPEQMLGAV